MPNPSPWRPLSRRLPLPPLHNPLSTTPSPPWHALAPLATSRTQIYLSASTDPYLNLAAEHFLLQRAPRAAAVLFLYANAGPCVVIGRNQNPWTEAAPAAANTAHHPIVRRRSGGGAVVHGPGNVNYSVTVARDDASFSRDRHAEMVARALRRTCPPHSNIRVNARHDIVVTDDDDAAEYKVSGSAYKLTRERALHHGTCLLAAPLARQLGALLRAPAAAYVAGRGVDSVRSAVRAVGVGARAFVDAVVAEFVAMYGPPDVRATLGERDDDFAHDEIVRGYNELVSPEWIYNQTPAFVFSTHPTSRDPRERPPPPSDIPQEFRATFEAKHGQILQADLAGFDGSALEGRHIHTITDWRQVLRPTTDMGVDALRPVGDWFNHLFGTSRTANRKGV